MITSTSIIGLVVEFVVAIDEARVRFTDDAFLFARQQLISLFHPLCIPFLLLLFSEQNRSGSRKVGPNGRLAIRRWS